MQKESLSPAEKEHQFNKMLVGEYLRWGSVDEVLKRHSWDLPISISGFYRVLDRWGVVRAAGPNNKLSEAIDFLEELTYERIPLERLYKKFPPSFQTSAVTLHRILSYVKEGITRRRATALIVTPEGGGETMLIGRDISTQRLEYGKPYGSYSLPMGFSKRNEAREDSILRVLQQEVFTRQTVEGEFPEGIIPDNPRPFAYFDIVDTRVSVYHVPLSRPLNLLENFTSYKLKDFQFLTFGEIEEMGGLFRVGVPEIAEIYLRYLTLLETSSCKIPFIETSDLNRNLSRLAVEYDFE